MDTEEDNDIDIDIDIDIGIDIDIDIGSAIAASGTSARAGGEAAQPTVDPDVVKRRAIIQIRNDTTIDEQTKRFRIQQLMNGSNRSHPNTAQGSAPFTTIRSASVRGGGGIGTGVTTCVHYPERKCNIIAPCCGEVFGCRICHDEQVTDGHEINRFNIREIVCKECNTRQDRSNKCINPNCAIKFSEYHCNICNLWMSASKEPFHCEKCGICRVGGRDEYIHCDICSMCIRNSAYDNHTCLKDKFKNSCPVCFEDMHTSRQPSLDLACGHAIHSHCFRKLAAFEYRCPICKKTLLNPETMARAWQERAHDIERQPMPADLAKIVDIGCYDCGAKSKNLDWHFLGVQCPNCDSFNTTVENNVTRRTTNE